MASSKKLGLKLTRDVLSELEGDISNVMLSDVQQMVDFVANYKATLMEAQLKLSKMIATIDNDQFPIDKKLEGQCLELGDVTRPSPANALQVLRDGAQKELEIMQSAVNRCFDGMLSKLKGQNDIDFDSRSLLQRTPGKSPKESPDTKPASQPTGKAVGQGFDPKKIVVNTPEITKREAVSEPPVVTRTTQPPAQIQPVKSSYGRELSHREIAGLLDDVIKETPQDHVTEEDEEPARVHSASSFEDDICPEDSASNVGVREVPRYTNYSASTTVPIEPVRIPMSALSNCAPVVIPRRKLAVDNVIPKVRCEWILNQFHPYKIWLQVSDAEYDYLAEQIQAHKSQIRLVSRDMVSVRLYCLAKYQDEWYRAYVIEVQPDGARVVFIDYGNVERVTFRDIAHLPRELSTAPWQAFRVAIFGVSPLEPLTGNPNRCEAWLPEAMNYLANKFQDQDASFECKVMAASPKLPVVAVVRMHVNGGTIYLHKEMVNKKLVLPATLPRILELLASDEATNTTVTAATAANPTGKNVAQTKLTTNSESKSQKTPPTSQIVTPLSQVGNGENSTVKGASSVSASAVAKSSVADAVSTKKEDSQSPSSTPILDSSFVQAFNGVKVPKSGAIEYCPPLPVGRSFHIKITELTSPDDFTFQLTDGQNLQAQSFLDQGLAEKCVTENKEVSIRIGRMLIYYSAKRKLYGRGKILKIEKNGTLLEVFDLDTGIVDADVEFPENVGALPKDLMGVNRLTFRASLDYSGSDKSPTLRSDIELRLAGCQLEAQVSSAALIDKAKDYRACAEPLPLLIYLVENKRKTFVGDLIFASKDPDYSSFRYNKATDLNTSSSDDDDEGDIVVPPANPDLFLLGYQPNDDAVVCKFFSKRQSCPRGELCSFRHDVLTPYRSTTEVEVFGKVESMELEPKTRVFARLPNDWRQSLSSAVSQSRGNLISMWFQLPLGVDDWRGKEDELLHTMEVGGEVTEFEEQYLEMEVELTTTYNSSSDLSVGRQMVKPLIPMETMYAAARVSSRLLGADQDEDQTLAWVRGFVEETLRDDCHARVRLLDYGNQTILSAEHIRPLSPSFAKKLPALAAMVHVNRHVAEGFLKADITNRLLVIDVLEIDPATDLPIVQLLAIGHGTDSSVDVKLF